MKEDNEKYKSQTFRLHKHFVILLELNPRLSKLQGLCLVVNSGTALLCRSADPSGYTKDTEIQRLMTVACFYCFAVHSSTRQDLKHITTFFVYLLRIIKSYVFHALVAEF